jgi:hypothetical protein
MENRVWRKEPPISSRSRLKPLLELLQQHPEEWTICKEATYNLGGWAAYAGIAAKREFSDDTFEFTQRTDKERKMTVVWGRYRLPLRGVKGEGPKS